MKEFFSRPREFSFKDVLAIAFSGTFLYFCGKAIGNRDALAVVQALVPLIGVILGGYFVQESAAMWFQRSQGISPYQSYQQPYYNQFAQTAVTAPVTTAAPPDIAPEP